jgi:hypothetical protein
MDEYLLYAVEVQAVEDIAMLHEQAAKLHDRAAHVYDEQALEMTIRGDGGAVARGVELASRARDLAAVERSRADQVRARHAEITAALPSPMHP